MRKKHITVYKVISNTDLTEGRGASVVLGIFLDPLHAGAFAVGKGVFGSDAEVRSEALAVVELDDGLYLLGERVLTEPPPDLAKVRQAALSKLSATERMSLGLTDLALKEMEGVPLPSVRVIGTMKPTR